MKTVLDSAMSLAAKGFHVFPVIKNSKLPAIKNYPKLATRDAKKIEQWFGQGKYNVGISTSSFGDGEHLLVVDVDKKPGKNGYDALLRLEMQGAFLPPTMEQSTPSGGRHLIYRCGMSLKQGTDTLGAGLDIRAKGGYIVGAGSELETGKYSLIDRPMNTPPQWLVEKLSAAKPKSTKPSPKNIDESRAIQRAKFFLENEAKHSVEGQGGNSTAYSTACRVKDFGVSEADCLAIMQDWNELCSPPWSQDELAQKVADAYRYGLDPVGIAAPEAQFTPVEAQTSAPKTDEPELHYLEKINQEYAIVFVEGGHFVLHENLDEKGRKKRSFLQEATFKRKFSPKTLQSNGRGKPLTQAEVWLDWENRREYAGLCFAPERSPGHNYYNLWRGFTAEPISFAEATADQKLGLEMFLSHARENVCNNDETLFIWLMGYFAHMIQRPFERPLTTLVFKGTKGTGKNALIDRVGRLLGNSHYLVAHDGRYLTSNFNGHMDSCLMLVLDEAFWSGDRSAEGKLKGITTAPEIMIERKGKEPYMVDNLVRLVVIGNEDWLVPASQDERRYAVFELTDGKKQNREFFHSMRVLHENKGAAGLLLYYLKTFDLSTVDVNDAPKTEALFSQKLKSAGPLAQWWNECLTEGRIVRYDFESGEDWPDKISKSALRKAYKSYCNERNIVQKYADITDIALGREIKTLMPSLITTQKITENNVSANAYTLPSLAVARREWEHKFGHEVNWNES